MIGIGDCLQYTVRVITILIADFHQVRLVWTAGGQIASFSFKVLKLKLEGDLQTSFNIVQLKNS